MYKTFFAMKRFLSLFIVAILTTFVCKAQYTQLTNLPTVYIETFDNRSVTSKTTYVYATMTYVDASRIVQYDSLQIRGRGNSTWGLAKKPYRIKFKESTKFLGKGFAKNKSWTLLANHADKSLLRNAVTFAMGDFLGQDFSPAAHFVDLVLNGTYLGNYQVSDQINVDNKRVEVYEQETVATDTSNITGGYLVEIDGFGYNETINFRTGKNLIVSVKSPDEDVINQKQKSYIQNYLNSFENALFGGSFTDPVDGYRPIVDSASLVSWYIATELSANVDGFWSTYLYKDRDNPKLYFGPLWDYDIAYNNCNRVGDVTNENMIDKGFGTDLTKVWMQQMIQDPWFNKAINEAWKRKLNEGLEQYLYNYIDSMAAHLEASQTKNYGKYSISSKVYNEIYLYSTYADYINQLKRFINEHTDYLTTLFASRVNENNANEGDEDNEEDDNNEEQQPVELAPFSITEGYYYRIYNKGTNKVMDIAGQSAESGANVVMWSPEYGRDTQLWEIIQVGEYFQLVNRATGMAFNDPSITAEVGTSLNAVVPDANDARQLWKFVTVNENNNYNIINAYTNHAINNSGGGAMDGNNILSYTNDERNSVSNNRQWRITPEELIPDYIPEEVKAALEETITEAEAFLELLNENQIGSGIFQYSESRIATLQQAVSDARIFESTVQDDYILANVNLAQQLEEARKQNLPDSQQLYTLRHKSSGYYLNIAEKLSIASPDNKELGQCYTFEPTDGDNGVFIKAATGVYLMLGTTNSWTMTGDETVTDKERATFNVNVSANCYYIYTRNGLLGTDAITENSTVYANKRESFADEVLRSEWIIEPYVDEEAEAMQAKASALETFINEVKATLESINPQWIGESPFQMSQTNINSLYEAIDLAETATYTSVEEYDTMMTLIDEALSAIYVLNCPSEDSDYNLQHLSGLNLSSQEGLSLALPDTSDAAQRFRLIAVEDRPNTYMLYTGGMYLSLYDIDTPSLSFSDTPRDELGQFVIQQVGAHEFTISSIAGYLGTELADAVPGNVCLANATDKGDNICWTLSAPLTSIPSHIDLPEYTSRVAYALRYNKTNQTISFVSDDMQAFKDTDVYIYTVGGRQLYIFKATAEQSVVELPSGTYIINWTYAGKNNSVKFKK